MAALHQAGEVEASAVATAEASVVAAGAAAVPAADGKNVTH